ncbi:Aste57867_18111 [Aphanomyces stellatus]|nr:hypothetical protein As57867_018049 [Aphanomyces stellatus]VFT94849.1 Aste57867_18111 [Aphanomyces stellatus]
MQLSLVLAFATIISTLQVGVSAQGFPVGPPGTAFFVKANANAVDKANALQKASNHFSNHADTNSANQGLQESVIFDKNHANANANNHGYQEAVSQADTAAHKNANQVAKGAVYFGRALREACFGDCVAGPVIPPSGFNNAKQDIDAGAHGSSLNKADQEQGSDAHNHADTKHIERHNIDQEGFTTSNANAKAGAHALSKANFFKLSQAEQARGVTQNNGLGLGYGR